MNDQWGTGPSSDDLAQPGAAGLTDRLLREEFARAPSDSVPTVGGQSHQEFAEGRPEGHPPPPRSRSHRAGTLAGLGVVGVLLAVLVVVAPGGSGPTQAPQTIHDVSVDSPAVRSVASTLTSPVPPPTVPTSPPTRTATTRHAASPTTTTTTTTTPPCILGLIC